MNTKKDVEILINYILNSTYGKSLDSKVDINYDYLYPMLKAIKKDLDRLEKLKKAIKILKTKRVDIPKLLANDFNNYNALAVFFGYKQLTKEEYELLKEVFRNE